MTGIGKKIFRNTIAPITILSGIEKGFVSDKKYLILNYHGIIPSKPDLYNGRHLLLQNFEKQLQYFKKNFKTISLSEMFD